ncbi:CpaF family protein [Paenibacillus qinlingensis]|uniref:Pilus assembly protein CpaF n=1 Tax=Paenibacillus qinlingensis TaxID=1837343 RepID=A0ABU1NVR4_9BACL|nr:CpaF family protein [Paenibacillus qinlingensis]MDR6551563.1 pilus assembly protein CpaF [Paenibacillus qinlingensis]
MSIEDLIKRRQEALLHNETAAAIETMDAGNYKTEIFGRVRQKIADNRELFASDMKQDIAYIRNMIWKIIEDELASQRTEWMLSSYDRSEILEQLMHTMFGFGILDALIHDTQVTEIMVNGIKKIYIEKDGLLQIARDRKGQPLTFSRQEELLHVIEKIVSPINRKVNESEPIVDARLPNGSRVNVVLNPVSLDGPAVTIRKFPEKPYTMGQLVEVGTLSSEIAEWLGMLVEAKYNIIISGGTGSGKTTFLNALGMFVPSQDRVVTIEDAAELKLNNVENLVRLETRPANIEGKGEIKIRELLRTALRMRPDRIIVGEVRGGEALDMLQAMNTGHDGSLSTGHANSAADMLSRLETMVLMSGLELPIPAIRQQVSSAIDFIVQLGKLRDGKRKVTEIVEVLAVENDRIQLQTIFKWDQNVGDLVSTGEKVSATDKWMATGFANHFAMKGGEQG